MAEWPTHTVSSWSEFLHQAGRATRGIIFPPNNLFRGQPDASWRLDTTLRRALPQNTPIATALAIEAQAERDFLSSAHLAPESTWIPVALSNAERYDLWGLMQHHSCPSRLLDWTASPFVAAYFAVEQRATTDGAMFVVHPRAVQQAFPPLRAIDVSEFQNEAAAASLYFFRPGIKSERSSPQQGQFSVSPNVLANHDDVICAQCEPMRKQHPGTMYFEKWIIPAPLKRPFLRELRLMNITGQSLFPGLDGLGRSIGESIRIREERGA